MATKNQNLSQYDKDSLGSAKGMKFGIVVAKWNKEITGALYQGAVDTFIEHGVNENDIITMWVPGSFELTFGARKMLEQYDLDAVIIIGAVIQGETRHFDFICQSVTYGATELNLTYDVPVIFGVLTTNDYEQAKERAGGKHGNKGVEAAVTAIEMARLAKM